MRKPPLRSDMGNDRSGTEVSGSLSAPFFNLIPQGHRARAFTKLLFAKTRSPRVSFGGRAGSGSFDLFKASSEM